jgi:hypothetical protein
MHQKDRKYTLNVTLRIVRATIVAVEAILITSTYSEYVYADLGTQDTKHMRHIETCAL